MTPHPSWNVEGGSSHPSSLLLVCLSPALILRIPRVFNSKAQTSEHDLPPQKRTTNLEAICAASAHDSKWHVHVRSKNPKRVPGSFSFRPRGRENVDSAPKLTCLLSYLSMATVSIHQHVHFQSFRQLTSFGGEKCLHNSLATYLLVLWIIKQRTKNLNYRIWGKKGVLETQLSTLHFKN